MKLVAIIAVLLATPTLAGSPPALGLSLPAKIVDVHDGDTLTVEVTYRVQVRLLSCWAPELIGESREAGRAAAKHLRDLALNQPAVLYVPMNGVRTVGDLFSFGRVLGHVWVYDQNLSEAQVAAGHASTKKGGRIGE